LSCPVCKERHEGKLSLDLARTWWQRVRDSDWPKHHAEDWLCSVLFGGGEYEAGIVLCGDHMSTYNTAYLLLKQAMTHYDAGRYHEALASQSSTR
ncbi:MAG: hypothetical protein AAFQ99_10785, partial [Pseudomonadota bacterium]